MSKALEAIERIENEYSIDEAVFYKEDFRQVRRELKALEIIKNKEVHIHWFKICETLEMYNENTSSWEKPLTKEEFNLLKKVQDND